MHSWSNTLGSRKKLQSLRVEKRFSFTETERFSVRLCRIGGEDKGPHSAGHNRTIESIAGLQKVE